MFKLRLLNRYISVFVFLSLSFCAYPSAIGQKGVVVSKNRIASEIGVGILKKGGNAIDAAVATGFALSVTEPYAGNIGGGGFMIIHLSDGNSHSIDFRETAPFLATTNMYLDDSLNVVSGMSLYSADASGVPGTVAGFALAHEKFGKLQWHQLVSPSIKISNQGFKLDPYTIEFLNHPFFTQVLSQYDYTRKIFLKKSPYLLGDFLVQKDLAKTLQRISVKGANGFYNGKTAKMIVETNNKWGGRFTEKDLESYSAIMRDPIVFRYRGYKVITMPPPSSGGVCLAQILNQLENIEFKEDEFHSYRHVHAMVKASKNAYSDRARYLGDPDFVDNPTDTLVSKIYSQSRWEEHSFELVIPSKDISYGNIKIDESEETTHFSVLDQWGNAVSVTYTLNGAFGSGMAVEGAGFLLNNEMDDFSVKPNTPNQWGLIGNEANKIEPGKRMLSSMTPTIVLDPNDNLFLVTGSPGGSTIITSIAQLLVNVIDFDMDVESSVQSPRFHHQLFPDVIFHEKGAFSVETINKLVEKGYVLKERSSIGSINSIYFDINSRRIFGSSDNRRNSSAVSY